MNELMRTPRDHSVECALRELEQKARKLIAAIAVALRVGRLADELPGRRTSRLTVDAQMRYRNDELGAALPEALRFLDYGFGCRARSKRSSQEPASGRGSRTSDAQDSNRDVSRLSDSRGKESWQVGRLACGGLPE